MSNRASLLITLSALAGLFACVVAAERPFRTDHAPGTGPADQLKLPPPFHTPSVRNTSRVVGWPKGKTPLAAPGFEVSLYADNLDNPRQAYVLPNKDVLVVEARREGLGRAQKSANRITLFRDTHGDGRPDVRETFLSGLNMPHGMLLLGGWFYVGNTDAVARYPYRGGVKIEGRGEKILDLPAGGHYTRNLIADPAGKKIYVAVGSATNVDEQRIDEKDPRRAAILEINPTAAACASTPAACAIRWAWIGSRGRKRSGRW